jgi:hypothetical protein
MECAQAGEDARALCRMNVLTVALNEVMER